MLLPIRSIFAKVYVISIFAVNCHSFEYDHDIEGYEGDDDRKGVDYSKYFKKDAVVAETQQNGAFINPIKDPFQSFFFQSPIEFFPAEAPGFGAESNKKEVYSPFDHLHAVRASIVGDGRTAASLDNPLTIDYFEAAQKKLQAEDDDIIRPGPHYVSHQLPVPKSLFRDVQKAHESRDDVETIRPPVKPKNSQKDDDNYDGFNAYDAFENLKNGKQSYPETFLYGSGKDVDYNTGKSSSTVSQYPAASGLKSVLEDVPTTTVRSYKKYSLDSTPATLQTKYLENLGSTTGAPLEKPVFEDEIEGISEAASSNCRRIASPEQADDMNCFVCQDGKAKYTQCSYSSGDDDGAESRIHFSTPIRLKRSPRKNKYSDDPYFASRERSRNAFKEFEKDHAAAESERQKDFHYVPWSPEEAETHSDEQASEAVKDAGNDCKKVEKEGVTCTVCKNAKTGGNFESCSYASAPKEHKYAFSAEKNYDSNDEPAEKEASSSDKEEQSEPREESKVSEFKAEATEAVPAITAYPLDKNFPELLGASTIVHEDSGSQKDDEEESEDDNKKHESDDGNEESNDEKPESESNDDTDEESEKKQSASDDEPSYYNFNFDEFKKNDDETPYTEEASEKKEKTEAEGEDDWDSYHYKIFPEFSKGSEESETQNNENKAPPPEKQDVEDVLAEFAKKDRSKCKKAEKNGMTCFMCVDKNKVQHEECMFIQESKPKATHVAYHELQRLKDPKKEEPAESKIQNVTQRPLSKPNDLPSAKNNPLAQTDSFPSPTNKRKLFFKKVNAKNTPELAVAASESLGTWVPFKKPKKQFSKKANKDLHGAASAPDSERLEDEPEFEIEDKQDKETSASNSEKISDEERQREEAADNAPRPKEIDVDENEGAYSHETKPIYSKLYGTTLPTYMVEKTEFEKDFDSASGFD